MLRIAVCDDDSLQLNTTSQTVGQILSSHSPEIDRFPDGEALLTALEKGGYRPDIAILDIQMPGVGGIAAGRRLNELVPSCRIIFLTSFLGYATDVYEVRHSYFVLKPELEKRMAPALERALEDLGRNARLAFRSDGVMVTVAASEVLYLERNLRKTRVVCAREDFFTSSRAEEILAEEPWDGFVQCHQSYWVNLHHVTAMNTDGFTLTDGSEVPISRSRRQAAREAFFSSIHRK